MRTLAVSMATLGIALLAAAWAVTPTKAHRHTTADKMIGHMVYFTLKDNSPQAKAALVAACKKYLANHPGTVHFSAGVLAEEFKREVNDRDWDVALQLVFKDKAAHDKYQDDPRHLRFIEENKDNWKKVRVFDAEVE